MIETLLMAAAGYAGYMNWPILWATGLGLLAGIWNSFSSQILVPWWVNRSADEDDKVPVASTSSIVIYFVGMMILGAATYTGVHYGARYLTEAGTFGPDPSVSQPASEEPS